MGQPTRRTVLAAPAALAIGGGTVTGRLGTVDAAEHAVGTLMANYSAADIYESGRTAARYLHNLLVLRGRRRLTAADLRRIERTTAQALLVRSRARLDLADLPGARQAIANARVHADAAGGVQLAALVSCEHSRVHLAADMPAQAAAVANRAEDEGAGTDVAPMAAALHAAALSRVSGGATAALEGVRWAQRCAAEVDMPDGGFTGRMAVSGALLDALAHLPATTAAAIGLAQDALPVADREHLYPGPLRLSVAGALAADQPDRAVDYARTGWARCLVMGRPSLAAKRRSVDLIGRLPAGRWRTEWVDVVQAHPEFS